MNAVAHHDLIRRAVLSLVFCLAVGFAAGPIAASPPRVVFDVPPSVACVDVTSAEFAEANPRQRLYAAEFRISLLVTSGSEQDLTEVLVLIDSPERRLRVVDFFPKNAVASDIVGPITREDSTEKTSSYDAGIQATFSTGPIDAKVTPGFAAHWTQKQATNESYQKLPPKKLILASGTTGGGHGVFFKLHPSSQEAFQGTHVFRCVFAAPAGWRFDRVTLSCQARGYSKVLFVRQEESSGRAQWTVALHRAGDLPAQQAARRLADAYRD